MTQYDDTRVTMTAFYYFRHIVQSIIINVDWIDFTILMLTMYMLIAI